MTERGGWGLPEGLGEDNRHAAGPWRSCAWALLCHRAQPLRARLPPSTPRTKASSPCCALESRAPSRPRLCRMPEPGPAQRGASASQPEGEAAANAARRGGRRGLAAWKGLCEKEEEAPTFGRRGALSIRGFRASVLRSVIGGGLQGRCWNIHNEPLRVTASPHSPFRPQCTVFWSRKPLGMEP